MRPMMPNIMDASAAGPSSAAPDAVLLRLRATALASLIALIVLGLVWELWLAPTGSRSWALKVLPLTLAIDGVARFRMVTHRWLSLLVWLYVAEGVVRGVTEGGAAMPLAWLQVLLGTVLFAACAAHVRWRLRKP
jgi:uncharacterized membrane protein